MNGDTELVAIWHNATIATGCIADAIFQKRTHPRADASADLDEAAKRMSKAVIELRQMLADRARRYGAGATPTKNSTNEIRRI